MNDATKNLRQNVYWLLGAIGIAIMIAKIVGAENVIEPSRYAPIDEKCFGAERVDHPTRPWPAQRPEPTLMFSSNDRSRWATIRALADHGTYIIGTRTNFRDKTKYTDQGIVFEDGWTSVDKVMNPDTGEFYSSKPPLFSTLLAGEYWLLKHTFGWTFAKDKWLIVCTVLITINVIPYAIMLILMAKLIEAYSLNDFAKLLAFATLSLATFLTTFSMTLNNHSPAAICVVFAIYPLLRFRTSDRETSRIEHVLVGFFGAMTATFELPALAFMTAIFVPDMLRMRWANILWMIVGALVPAIAWFATNNYAMGRLLPVYSEFGGPWYEYAGSNWVKLKEVLSGMKYHPGIDNAQESRNVYLFHCLLGHHGWFSLTPIWLLGLIGIFRTLPQAIKDIRNQNRPSTWTLPIVYAMTLSLTLVMIIFFVYIQKTNNYGGNTSGLRWFFWLTPLWILTLLPAGEWADRTRLRRLLTTLLLSLSVLSVFYPAWNPWRPSWLQILFERLEWVNYDRIVK